MKMCKRCNIEKPVAQFYKQASSKDGLQRFCKSCANEFSKISEHKNQPKYRAIRQGVRDRFVEEMRAYKAERGCQHCGEANPICLDLHHLDPSIKDFHPSETAGRKLFYEEAEKCIVLCSNCHRKEHDRLNNLRFA